MTESEPYRHRTHEHEVFYKYVTAATAKKILETGELKWSSPRLFNDQFDIPRRLALPFTGAELQAALETPFIEVLEGRLSTNHPKLALLASMSKTMIQPDQREEFLAEVRRTVNDGQATLERTTTELNTAWQTLLPRLRIFCLSEVDDSPTMWAYYGAESTGAVLTFKADDATNSALLVARQIIYADEPPTLPPKEVWAQYLVTAESPPWSEWFRKIHTTKTTNWAHEREWRVWSYARRGETGEVSFWPFHERELAEIAVGANMTPEDEAAIVSLARARFPATRLRRAVLDYDSRRIIFQPL